VLFENTALLILDKIILEKLKQQLKEDGNETMSIFHQLKMEVADGNLRLNDVADTEQLLRLIQSMPSIKAEPFKVWLARVGSERIDEIADLELAIVRALETYLRIEYSRNWINQGLKTIEVRLELTDDRKTRRNRSTGLYYLTRRNRKSMVSQNHSENKSIKV